MELDTAALESPFATCPSKEDKARLYNRDTGALKDVWQLMCPTKDTSLNLA